MIVKGNIVHENGVEKGFIRIEGKQIAEVGKTVSGNAGLLDFQDSYIVPGFIDMHLHGIHNYLVDNGIDDLSQICRILPEYGVTSFLPTITPLPDGEDTVFLKRLAGYPYEGATILGFHLEGPFLKLTGALPGEAVSAADSQRVVALIQAAKPHKVVFSISPDLEGIEQIIPLMTTGNTPVFITHTAASVEQTQKAIAAGARHATHFYDVFPFPETTEPGVRPCGAVEAILADPSVSVDFILDGVHVDPVAVKMALACKANSPGGVCLITDANIGAGLEAGRFNFANSGEIYFEYKGSPARLVKDNTLAGSGLTMEMAFKNAVKLLNLNIPQAVKLVSTNPAHVTDARYKGILKAGYDADFVVLDNQLNVLQTWIGGVCRFKKESRI